MVNRPATMPAASLRAVVLDVGETLVDETRAWGLWAEALGVPRLTFFALLGAVIERGEHHRKVFGYFHEEAVAAAKAQVEAAPAFCVDDLYPDALPCLRALRAMGLRVGIAGNQPAAIERALREAGVPADFVASSASWGVEKPSAAFFERVVAASGAPASSVAYVGDRLDNDVLPAREAGMVAVLIKRGPWGHLHAGRPEAALAHHQIASLDELVRGLSRQMPEHS